MVQEIEIEFKNLLNKDEFNYMLTRFPFPKKAIKQTNYYFETEDFSLKKNYCALRIRKKDADYQLTLKEPHPEGLLETHASLTYEEALSWINGHIREKEPVTNQLHNIHISPLSLVYYGSLITERREVNYEGVLLVLDYSTYNGHSDYEFELEAPNHTIGHRMFNTILKEHNISKKTTSNKIERFFKSLR